MRDGQYPCIRRLLDRPTLNHQVRPVEDEHADREKDRHREHDENERLCALMSHLQLLEGMS